MVEALQRNPLAVAAFVVMILGFARWTRRQWRGQQRMTAAPAWLLYGLFWLIMAFWIARNIPGGDLALTCLSPRRSNARNAARESSRAAFRVGYGRQDLGTSMTVEWMILSCRVCLLSSHSIQR